MAWTFGIFRELNFLLGADEETTNNCNKNFNPLSPNRIKMVKHIQTSRRLTDEELFECV